MFQPVWANRNTLVRWACLLMLVLSWCSGTDSGVGLSKAHATSPAGSSADKADHDSPADSPEVSKASTTSPLTFQVRPKAIKFDSSLLFRSKGSFEPSRLSESALRLMMSIRYVQGNKVSGDDVRLGVTPLFSGPVTDLHVVTDTGEQLAALQPRETEHLASWLKMDGQARYRTSRPFAATVSVAPPTRPCMKMNVRGSVRVTYGKGKPAELVLAPLSKYLNHKVGVRQLPGLKLFLMQVPWVLRGGYCLLVAWPEAAGPHIYKIIFHDQAGKILKYQVSPIHEKEYDDRFKNERYVRFYIRGEPVKVTLQIYLQIQTQDVPFAIDNLQIFDPPLKKTAAPMSKKVNGKRPARAGAGR